MTDTEETLKHYRIGIIGAIQELDASQEDKDFLMKSISNYVDTAQRLERRDFRHKLQSIVDDYGSF